MKLERIVVAIDFSERSIAAAQWVARQVAPNAELILVHVLELPPPPRFLRGGSYWREDEIETYKTGARARLRQLGTQIGGGSRFEEVRVGRAHDEVVRVAREHRADLIVVGSHRDREAFWNRLGSTAERVMGFSTVPVLVVHGAPREVPKQLLAAIDDSELGTRVIDYAHDLARRFDARGKVVHVLPHWTVHRLLTPGEFTPHDHRLARAQQQFVIETQEWLGKALGQKSREMRPAVLVGEPAETILREARETGAHMLVIGRDRKGRARPFTLGSTASAVVRAANCPVLVIPLAVEMDAAESSVPGMHYEALTAS